MSTTAATRPLARRPWFWGVVAVLAILAVLPRLLARPEPPPPLPVLARLPDFTLTDQTGGAFGSEDLRGRVWLADFMFTRCPTACPRLTALMKRVQHLTGDAKQALSLVSFTIDPAHDTPSVLARYARQHGATRDWAFVTGDYDALETTIVRGFKVSTGREDEPVAARGRALPADRLAEVFHGTHLVLVDADLQVRGYYGSTDDGVAERIAADVARLNASAPVPRDTASRRRARP